MNAIAESVVRLVAYLDCNESDDPHDDAEAIESIATILADATDDEKNALSMAAKRALEEEQSPQRAPSDNYVQAYSKWMEDMFGDEWVGNDRA